MLEFLSSRGSPRSRSSGTRTRRRESEGGGAGGVSKSPATPAGGGSSSSLTPSMRIFSRRSDPGGGGGGGLMRSSKGGNNPRGRGRGGAGGGSSGLGNSNREAGSTLSSSSSDVAALHLSNHSGTAGHNRGGRASDAPGGGGRRSPAAAVNGGGSSASKLNNSNHSHGNNSARASAGVQGGDAKRGRSRGKKRRDKGAKTGGGGEPRRGRSRGGRIREGGRSRSCSDGRNKSRRGKDGADGRRSRSCVRQQAAVRPTTPSMSASGGSGNFHNSSGSTSRGNNLHNNSAGGSSANFHDGMATSYIDYNDQGGRGRQQHSSGLNMGRDPSPSPEQPPPPQQQQYHGSFHHHQSYQHHNANHQNQGVQYQNQVGYYQEEEYHHPQHRHQHQHLEYHGPMHSDQAVPQHYYDDDSTMLSSLTPSIGGPQVSPPQQAAVVPHVGGQVGGAVVAGGMMSSPRIQNVRLGFDVDDFIGCDYEDDDFVGDDLHLHARNRHAERSQQRGGARRSQSAHDLDAASRMRMGGPRHHVSAGGVLSPQQQQQQHQQRQQLSQQHQLRRREEQVQLARQVNHLVGEVKRTKQTWHKQHIVQQVEKLQEVKRRNSGIEQEMAQLQEDRRQNPQQIVHAPSPSGGGGGGEAVSPRQPPAQQSQVDAGAAQFRDSPLVDPDIGRVYDEIAEQIAALQEKQQRLLLAASSDQGSSHSSPGSPPRRQQHQQRRQSMSKLSMSPNSSSTPEDTRVVPRKDVAGAASDGDDRGKTSSEDNAAGGGAMNKHVEVNDSKANRRGTGFGSIEGGKGSEVIEAMSHGGEEDGSDVLVGGDYSEEGNKDSIVLEEDSEEASIVRMVQAAENAKYSEEKEEEFIVRMIQDAPPAIDHSPEAAVVKVLDAPGARQGSESPATVSSDDSVNREGVYDPDDYRVGSKSPVTVSSSGSGSMKSVDSGVFDPDDYCDHDEAEVLQAKNAPEISPSLRPSRSTHNVGYTKEDSFIESAKMLSSQLSSRSLREREHRERQKGRALSVDAKKNFFMSTEDTPLALTFSAKRHNSDAGNSSTRNESTLIGSSPSEQTSSSKGQESPDRENSDSGKIKQNQSPLRTSSNPRQHSNSTGRGISPSLPSTGTPQPTSEQTKGLKDYRSKFHRSIGSLSDQFKRVEEKDIGDKMRSKSRSQSRDSKRTSRQTPAGMPPEQNVGAFEPSRQSLSNPRPGLGGSVGSSLSRSTSIPRPGRAQSLNRSTPTLPDKSSTTPRRPSLNHSTHSLQLSRRSQAENMASIVGSRRSTSMPRKGGEQGLNRSTDISSDSSLQLTRRSQVENMVSIVEKLNHQYRSESSQRNSTQPIQAVSSAPPSPSSGTNVGKQNNDDSAMDPRKAPQIKQDSNVQTTALYPPPHRQSLADVCDNDSAFSSSSFDVTTHLSQANTEGDEMSTSKASVVKTDEELTGEPVGKPKEPSFHTSELTAFMNKCNALQTSIKDATETCDVLSTCAGEGEFDDDSSSSSSNCSISISLSSEESEEGLYPEEQDDVIRSLEGREINFDRSKTDHLLTSPLQISSLSMNTAVTNENEEGD